MSCLEYEGKSVKVSMAGMDMHTRYPARVCRQSAPGVSRRNGGTAVVGW